MIEVLLSVSFMGFLVWAGFVAPTATLFSWPMFSHMSLMVPELHVRPDGRPSTKVNVYDYLTPGNIAGEDILDPLLAYLSTRVGPVYGVALVYDRTGAFTIRVKDSHVVV